MSDGRGRAGLFPTALKLGRREDTDRSAVGTDNAPAGGGPSGPVGAPWCVGPPVSGGHPGDAVCAGTASGSPEVVLACAAQGATSLGLLGERHIA